MSLHLDPDQGSYIAPSFDHATVADAMRRGVVSCPPDAPAVDVARLMAMRHIHAIVVAGLHHDPGGGERLGWGVVTDTDLLRAAQRGFDGVTAGEIADTEPVAVPQSARLTDAVRMMLEAGVTHLVVAEDGRPVGVLSTLDIAGVLAWGRG
jgi:CBS domain-containing protein